MISTTTTTTTTTNVRQMPRDRMAEAQKIMSKALEFKRSSRHYRLGLVVWAYNSAKEKNYKTNLHSYWIEPWQFLEQWGHVLWKSRLIEAKSSYCIPMQCSILASASLPQNRERGSVC